MCDIRENIKTNLSRFLTSKKISQKEFAEKLGVSAPAVSNWLRGTNTPDIEMIAKICKVLDISVNDLFGLSKATLSPFEKELLYQYRSKPELQAAVNLILGLGSDTPKYVYGEAAAYGGKSAKVNTTEEKLKELYRMKGETEEQ